ncbi:MAG: hypothetical protein ABIT71_13585 [Vicinamibacteraceae bacterium]
MAVRPVLIGVGGALLAAGVIMSFASMFHLAPGVTQHDIALRRRQRLRASDYSRLGWRLVIAAYVVGIAGVVCLFVSGLAPAAD